MLAYFCRFLANCVFLLAAMALALEN